MGASQLKPEFPPLLTAGFHFYSLAELRALCVAPFDGVSITRRAIMDHLAAIVDKLSTAGIVGEVWVDGSFLTQKIDPDDSDILVRVASSIYDTDPQKRAVVDWASHPDLYVTHTCDAYKWIEYTVGHPLHSDSESDRVYWTDWYGKSRKGILKGIAVITLPTAK
jgi:hypothetical protein